MAKHPVQPTQLKSLPSSSPPLDMFSTTSETNFCSTSSSLPHLVEEAATAEMLALRTVDAEESSSLQQASSETEKPFAITDVSAPGKSSAEVNTDFILSTFFNDTSSTLHGVPSQTGTDQAQTPSLVAATLHTQSSRSFTPTARKHRQRLVRASSSQPNLGSPSSQGIEKQLSHADEFSLATSPPSFQIPIIQNVIASAHLQCEIDLRELAISTRNAEYNPRKVNAVVLRIREPRCTGLVFRTGRLMITGSKSELDARRGGKIMAKLVGLATKLPVVFANFKIENVIASADCGVPVRLEGLANEHKEFCNYEPELFAGLVYRYNPNEYTKAVLLIFVSGKVVITGCKSLDTACSVFESMYPVVAQFKK